MNCKKCGGKTKVIDSRSASNGTKRRHRCKNCGYRFSTFETSIDVYTDLLYLSENVKRETEVLFKEIDNNINKHIINLRKLKDEIYM
jgi:transcriptional regulator NrdR family protein